MPRVSSAPEDALHFKGSFADGWGKVIEAQSVVFQYPPDKETGRQNPAGLFLEMTIQRYQDDQGNQSAEPPEQVMLSIQGANKSTGALDLAHPGNYPDGDPSKDPEDCGAELGACGNTVYASQDGYQINDKTKWMSFCQSLQEKGFKPDYLKRTYFPDLIGLYAYFKTETRKKFRDDQANDPTVFVVTKIVEFPYEKKATAAKGTTKAAAKPAATKAAAPAPTPVAPAAEPATNGNGESTAEDIAAAIVTTTLAAAKKGVTLPSVDKLKVEAFLVVSKHKPAVPAALKKAVQDQLGDLDWLQAIGAANNVFEVGEDGKVTFAG